jgi:O-antigen/teichoic acid export membrane protein
MALGLCIIPALRWLIKDYDSLEALGINAILIFCLYLFKSASSYFFFAYRSSVIRADQREYIINVVSYVTSLISCILQIAVLVVFHNYMVYTITVICCGIFENIINAIIATCLYPNLFIKEKERLPKEEIVSMLKDCGSLFLYNVNNVVLKATDNLVFSSFLGLTAVGLYSNYYMLYTTINTILIKFIGSCRASIANVYASEETSRSYFFFEVINFMVVFIYGTACVGVAVVGDEFIRCWIGDKFVLSQPFALLIGIEILFSGLKTNLGQMRNVTGVFQKAWYRPIISACINILLSVILVQNIGMIGVIIGTLCSDLFSNFMVDPRIIHKYSFKGYKPVSYYYIKNLGYISVLCIVGAIDFVLCRNIRFGNDIITLIIHAGICSVSVPMGLLAVYRRSPIVKYMLEKLKLVKST